MARNKGSHWCGVVGVLLLLVAPVHAAPQAAPKTALLPQNAVRAWQKLSADPPPKKLAGNWHFFASNEQRLEQFRTVSEALGGIAVGVGTDQNYLLAAWAKPQVLVLVDFDQMVVDLHQAYRALLLQAATPDEFLALWSPKAAARSKQLVAREFSEPKLRARVLRVFAQARWPVYVRLRQQQKRFRRLRIPSFLTEQSQYDYVVELVRAKRVFAIRGDLTGKRAMKTIAAAAKLSGQPIRLLYLSNAEQYFSYGAAFRENIRRLPFDKKSLVLRTQHMTKKHGFAYVVQRMVDFRQWLLDPRVRQVRDLLQPGAPHWSRSPVMLPHRAATAAKPRG